MTFIFHVFWFFLFWVGMNFYLKNIKERVEKYWDIPFAKDCSTTLKDYLDSAKAPKCFAPDSDYSGRTTNHLRAPQAICLFMESLFLEDKPFVEESFFQYWKEECNTSQ